MIATSLRLRLILAFSALVSLILFIGVVSYVINVQVRTDVADLRASNMTDLRNVALDQVGLEIEGYWNPGGTFIATKVTPGPSAMRPRLRGVIQAVSTADRTVTMYGVVVHVVDETESADIKNGSVNFADLRAGLRAELSCRVDDKDHWIASKIQLQDVKSSDKVKGMVTATELDGVAPESIEIHGLKIVVEPKKERGPESALSRIGQATDMLKALHECRVLAHKFVDAARRSEPGHADSDPGTATADTVAGGELAKAADRFERLLQGARAGMDPQSAPTGDFLQYLDEMTSRMQILRHHIQELHGLRAAGLGPARTFLDRTLEPFLDQLLLFVYAYLDKGGEELRDELSGLQGNTETTTRVALGTSLVAVVVAIVLGLLVWRSIHRPIQQLHDAAVALGQGHLDTRIAIDSRDEIGVLANAFNRMASDLASTTVSVSSLERMFDSMAAGVILSDRQGSITNANRAAQTLVGHTRDSLVGKPFDSICRCAPGEGVPMVGGPGTDIGGSIERTFVRRDGSEFPVSLSVAEMRTQDGSLQGYVFVAQDLTPLKRIEAQLRESLGEKEMLLREVHHRVKNNMQVISSLLAMQSTAGDPEVLMRLEESQNRIRTIALIHEQLYQSTEVAHIATRNYLDVLAAHLLQSFGMADRVQLVQEVDNFDLDLDQSLACGLIVNELLTNALKYAFPAGRRGTIRLSLRETDGTRTLEVADDGCGLPPQDPTARKTLGTSLITKLARQLRGRVEVDGSGGTTVRIIFPRSQPAAAMTP